MPARSIFLNGNTFRGKKLKSKQTSPRPGEVTQEASNQTMAGGSLLLQPGLGQSYSSQDKYEHLTGS